MGEASCPASCSAGLLAMARSAARHVQCCCQLLTVLLLVYALLAMLHSLDSLDIALHAVSYAYCVAAAAAAAAACLHHRALG
jgi:hypothetical protein